MAVGSVFLDQKVVSASEPLNSLSFSVSSFSLTVVIIDKGTTIEEEGAVSREITMS